MTTVYTENVECPVCFGKTAQSDLDIHTNERDFNCLRCGFSSVTEVVEFSGKKFWKLTMEMPLSKDGKVAWPELVPNRSVNKWNRKDYGVMPSYEAVPEVFGAEEAKDDGEPSVQTSHEADTELEL